MIVDTSLCFVFFADFLGRLRHTESKSGYFFHQLGWLDLLGSLPFPGLRIARVFRVARVVRLVREVGMKTLVNKVLHDRAGSALLTSVFIPTSRTSRTTRATRKTRAMRSPGNGRLPSKSNQPS